MNSDMRNIIDVFWKKVEKSEKQNWKILLFLKKYLIWEYCDILFKYYLYMFLKNIE